jgi:hypothetical protein
VTPPEILLCQRDALKDPLPSNDGETETHRLSSDKKWTSQKTICSTILLLHIFFAARTSLPSRCLAANMLDT